jgi:N,N-dimethylformamidase
MLMITGYSNRIHARPGDTVNFMVSCENPCTYTAQIVRIVCGDDNPAGPGIKEIAVATDIDGSYLGRKQEIRAGSCILVHDSAPFAELESFSLQAFIWPTTPDKGRQGLITRWRGSTESGFALVIDAAGCIAFEIGGGNGATATISTGHGLHARRWYRVGASFDADAGILRVFQQPLEPIPSRDNAASIERRVGIKPAWHAEPLVFAAAMWGPGGRLDGYYNGKLDSPRLMRGVLSDADFEAITGRVPERLMPAVIGAWDFSQQMESMTAVDLSPNRLDGTIVNFPARAMTGWNWSAETINFNDAPEQWGAIHFHDDDIFDADWETDFALIIPDTMKSGLYAARLRSGDAEEYIPFAVGPAPGKESRIALLLPTASYMAYGNDRLGMDGGGAELLNNILNVISPHEIFLNDHVEYGGSLYDAHSDGSGVCYASRLRPLVNMRPKRQGTLGGFGHSKLWQFAADTHLTDWLEAAGQDYDVITDEELHYTGYSLLAPYKVLITGTHPEYVSTEMSNALYAYRQRGGRIMYLGGDGFYWRIAFHPYIRGIIELRRGESGVRAWIAAPGETYQSFDKRLGGLWARLGRTPQALVGVGFAAQGFDLSTGYERLPDSYRPEAAFVFDGVGDETIGDFGLIGGGAAGLEVDRAGAELGTPPNALILARSKGLTNTYLIVPEEFLETGPGLGAHENALARADMVLFSVAGGGAVFTPGSIAWAGSLSHNDYQNNVARITGNVLARFLADAPIET